MVSKRHNPEQIVTRVRSRGSLCGSDLHVSSKQLPRYLTAISYRFNPRRAVRESFPQLAYVALHAAPFAQPSAQTDGEWRARCRP